MKLSRKRFKLFKEVIECNAISGYETNMARLLKNKYNELGFEVLYDNLGSNLAHKSSKKANAPKVLVLAHMDEVGLRIAKIEEDGSLLLSSSKLSIWEQILMAQRVYVITKNNKVINGVIGTIPPHLLTPQLRAKPISVDTMHVDIGCKNKQEAIDLGIEPYDSVIVRGDLEELGDGSRLLGKAFDNRYGCLLGLETLEELKDYDLDIDLYVGASVQEEVGCNGALTISTKIKPDFAIVLDCSPANDIGTLSEVNGRLGEGVLLRYVDRTMIAFPQLLDFQKQICKDSKVKYQYYQSAGGTDAGNIHKNFDGILTLTHCICARNIHSNASIIDLNDYEAAKKSLIKMLKVLNKDKIEELKTYNR